jgi:hypothetical protein
MYEYENEKFVTTEERNTELSDVSTKIFFPKIASQSNKKEKNKIKNNNTKQ